MREKYAIEDLKDSEKNMYAVFRQKNVEQLNYKRFLTLLELDQMDLIPVLSEYEGILINEIHPENVFFGTIHAGVTWNGEEFQKKLGVPVFVSDILAIQIKGKTSYYYMDSDCIKELVNLENPIVKISGYQCHLVDLWEKGEDLFLLGSHTAPKGEVFYYALTARFELEYDHKPERSEVEEDHYREIARR